MTPTEATYPYPLGASVTRSGGESRLLHFLYSIGSVGQVRVPLVLVDWICAHRLDRLRGYPPRFDVFGTAKRLEENGWISGLTIRAGTLAATLTRPQQTWQSPLALVERGWMTRLTTQELWLLNSLHQGGDQGDLFDALAAHQQLLLGRGEKHAEVLTRRAAEGLRSHGILTGRPDSGFALVANALSGRERAVDIRTCLPLATWMENTTSHERTPTAALCASRSSADECVHDATAALARLASLSDVERTSFVRRLLLREDPQNEPMARALPRRVTQKTIRSKALRWIVREGTEHRGPLQFPAPSHLHYGAQANLVLHTTPRVAVATPLQLRCALLDLSTAEVLWSRVIAIDSRNPSRQPVILPLHTTLASSVWSRPLVLATLAESASTTIRLRAFVELFP